MKENIFTAFKENIINLPVDEIIKILIYDDYPGNELILTVNSDPTPVMSNGHYNMEKSLCLSLNNNACCPLSISIDIPYSILSDDEMNKKLMIMSYNQPPEMVPGWDESSTSFYTLKEFDDLLSNRFNNDFEKMSEYSTFYIVTIEQADYFKNIK